MTRVPREGQALSTRSISAIQGVGRNAESDRSKRRHDDAEFCIASLRAFERRWGKGERERVVAAADGMSVPTHGYIRIDKGPALSPGAHSDDPGRRCGCCGASNEDVTLYEYPSGYLPQVSYTICEVCCWKFADQGGL